jgi:hypothetical protein
MTPQQLLGVGVRLFATWLAITSVAYFTSIPSQIVTIPNFGRGEIVIAYALGGGYLVAAVLLWFFPMLVAHKLLPRTQFANRLSFQGHELARAGCGLLGLWLFAKTLPTLVWYLFRAFLMANATSAFSVLAADAKVDLAVALFELALAIAFIVKAGTFANLVVPGAASPSTDTDTDNVEPNHPSDH